VRPVALAPFIFSALVLLPSRPSWGETCGKPDLVVTFPPDDAENVPSNAELAAFYRPTAVYDDEAVVLETDGDASELTASFDPAEVSLRVTPPDGLVPGADHVVTWPKLHGTGTTSLGSGARVSFGVSEDPDETAADFDGLDHVEWDVKRHRDDCTDSTEERFAFDLRVGRASDDSGAENLALVVFQTRGPTVDLDSAPRPVLVTRYPGDGETVRVERSLGEGSGEVCFAAFVRDLVPDHAPSGADREVCAKTIEPPFFYGCRMSARSVRSPNGRASLAFALFALSLLLLRGHRRSA
jgi:hypothetical protein